MKELLKRFGMGEHLSNLCIGCFGGHIYTIQLALLKLQLSKGDHAAIACCPGGTTYEINACIREHGHTMIPLLKGLAIDGIYPLRSDADHKAAEIACLYNVAGTMSVDDKVIALPPDVLFGLETQSASIPASQVTRLAIAEVLQLGQPNELRMTWREYLFGL
jgi:hypothetical protein